LTGATGVETGSHMNMKIGIGILLGIFAITATAVMVGQHLTATELAARAVRQDRLGWPDLAVTELSEQVRRACPIGSDDAQAIIYLLACSGLEVHNSIPASAQEAACLAHDRSLTPEDAVMGVLGLEPGKGGYLNVCER
jgi:hypothetical protein